MENKKKLAFLLMSADIIHPGHLNIIHEALKLNATIMVGLYSDEAIASYKRVPFMNFEQRKTVLENIKGVDIVIEQKTRNVRETLLKYKPDYFVHGTDWRNGALAKERQNIIDIISEWGGVLVEPEYTKGICSSNAHAVLKERGTTPEARQAKLFKSIEVKKHLRVAAVYDCITASIVDKAVVKNVGRPIAEFDALWIDNNIIAEQKGKKSAALLDLSELHNLITNISNVTTKSFILNYGDIIVEDQFIDACQNYEKLGVSIVAIDLHPSIEEIKSTIARAKLNLLGDTMKFALNVEASLINNSFIEGIEDAGFASVILYGDIEDMMNAGNAIKTKSEYLSIGAIIDNINVSAKEMYKNGINILIYKNQITETVKNDVNVLANNILNK